MWNKNIKNKIIIILLIVINIIYFYNSFNIYLKNDIYKIRYFLQDRYSFAWSGYSLDREYGNVKLFGFIPETKYEYELLVRVQDGWGSSGETGPIKANFKEEPNLLTSIYLPKEIEISYNLSDFLKGKTKFYIYYYEDFDFTFTVEDDDKGYFISMVGKDYEYTYYENVEPIQRELKAELEKYLDSINIKIDDIDSLINQVSEDVINEYRYACKTITIFKLVSYSILILCQVGIYYLVRKKYINRTGSEKWKDTNLTKT